MSSIHIRRAQLRNARQHSRLIARRREPRRVVAQYASRDPITGLRQLTDPAGGRVYARYRSNSDPAEFPATERGELGLSGGMDQRPA